MSFLEGIDRLCADYHHFDSTTLFWSTSVLRTSEIQYLQKALSEVPLWEFIETVACTTFRRTPTLDTALDPDLSRTRLDQALSKTHTDRLFEILALVVTSFYAATTNGTFSATDGFRTILIPLLSQDFENEITQDDEIAMRPERSAMVELNYGQYGQVRISYFL